MASFSRALQDLLFYTSRRRSGIGYDRGTTGYENIQDSLDDLKKPMVHEIEKQSSQGPQDETLLLSDLAHDLPNHWVCETCTALHPSSRGDSPLRPELSTCPRGWQRSPRNAHGHPSYRLGHRHVQLAFKYTRLRKWRHHLHLRRILAETHASFTPNALRPGALEGQYSAYPKIVGGRFLLLSTWAYFPGDENPTEQGMGALRICEHQSFVGDPLLLPLSQSKSQSKSISNPDSSAHPPKTALSRIIRSAFKRPHHEMCGSCTLCPTDFSVQVSPERAIVRVWQDFGGDGSPLDPAWTVLTETEAEAEAETETETRTETKTETKTGTDTQKQTQTQTQTQTHSPAREQKPGSIRESFGHCMREALHDIRNRKESCEAMGNIYIF